MLTPDDEGVHFRFWQDGVRQSEETVCRALVVTVAQLTIATDSVRG
jgi:hypothetical protein